MLSNSRAGAVWQPVDDLAAAMLHPTQHRLVLLRRDERKGRQTSRPWNDVVRTSGNVSTVGDLLRAAILPSRDT